MLGSSLPLKVKYRSFFKYIITSESVVFKNTVGKFCLYSIENAVLTWEQLELIRKHIYLKSRKYAKVWFLAHPSQGVSRKGLGSRMGSGKGGYSHFVFKLRAGSKFISFDNITLAQVLKMVKCFKSFLPFRLRILYIPF